MTDASTMRIQSSLHTLVINQVSIFFSQTCIEQHHKTNLRTQRNSLNIVIFSLRVLKLKKNKTNYSICLYLISIIFRTVTVTLIMIRHLSEPQKTFPVVAHVRSQWASLGRACVDIAFVGRVAYRRRLERRVQHVESNKVQHSWRQRSQYFLAFKHAHTSCNNLTHEA